MPETLTGWMMFAFFGVGAVGGWVVVLASVKWLLDAIRVQLWLDRAGR